MMDRRVGSQPQAMSLTPETERILIFDCGAQYGQLIARRVREQDVFCQIVHHNITAQRVRELKPRGIILSGGPASVYGPGAPSCDPKIFDLEIPLLGICYGMQLACHLMGGKVVPADHREFGRAICRVSEFDGIFADLPEEMIVWMSHGDQVQVLPPRSGRGHRNEGSFISLASTDTCPVAAVKHSE